MGPSHSSQVSAESACDRVSGCFCGQERTSMGNRERGVGLSAVSERSGSRAREARANHSAVPRFTAWRKNRKRLNERGRRRRRQQQQQWPRSRDCETPVGERRSEGYAARAAQRLVSRPCPAGPQLEPAGAARRRGGPSSVGQHGRRQAQRTTRGRLSCVPHPGVPDCRLARCASSV